MKIFKSISLASVFLLAATNLWAANPNADTIQKVAERIRNEGELAPLPEVKPLLIEVADLMESPALLTAIASSKYLQRMRSMVKISLFHLNLQFEILDPGYPYAPPFEKPFPARPTLEAMEEAARFFELVKQTTGLKTDMFAKLRSSPYFESLHLALSGKKTEVATTRPKSFSATEIIEKPVDTFIDMHTRLTRFGETASFPEFEPQVEDVLAGLNAKDVIEFARQDRAFAIERVNSIRALLDVSKSSGSATNLQSAYQAPFPYRRTIQAIERGLLALDTKIRAVLPEEEDWHKVELSHYVGDKPMLRPVYHTQRYKYEMFGLLANPDVVVLPFGDIDMANLIRLRAAPWALLGETTQIRRIDRFWHTPYEEWVHDGNHARRMYFYDKLKWKKLGITTEEQKYELYRQQEIFLNNLLEQTRPDTKDPLENELRKLERVIIFETPHETALTPDPESFLQDLFRGPRVKQPFERMRRGHAVDLEADRTFDGNHISGALHFPLDLREPTFIDRYLDRAQGFLTNVDNKLRVGFYDSPFNIDTNVAKIESRNADMLAKAAIRLMSRLGYKKVMNQAVLAEQIRDRSGQPELDSYFSINERDKHIVELVRLEKIRVANGGNAADASVDFFFAAAGLTHSNHGTSGNRCDMRLGK